MSRKQVGLKRDANVRLIEQRIRAEAEKRELADSNKAADRQYLEEQCAALAQLQRQRAANVAKRESKFSRERQVSDSFKFVGQGKQVSPVEWTRQQRIDILERRLEQRQARLPPSSISRRTSVVKHKMKRAWIFLDYDQDGYVDAEDVMQTFVRLNHTVTSKGIARAIVAQISVDGRVGWKSYRNAYLEYVTTALEGRPVVFHTVFEFLTESNLAMEDNRSVPTPARGVHILSEQVLEIFARKFGEPSARGVESVFGIHPNWARPHTLTEFLEMMTIGNSDEWKYTISPTRTSPFRKTATPSVPEEAEEAEEQKDQKDPEATQT